MSKQCFDMERDRVTAACAALQLTECAATMESPTETPTSSSSLQSGSLTQSSQGYDVEFDPPLESKYKCPICLMAIREPVQTPCGHRFCRGCIEQSLRDAGRRCPVDNGVLTEDQLFPDNFAKREILSLTVRCFNTDCSQQMELRHLDFHVAKCQYAKVLCPLCQTMVQKTQLEEHTAHDCARRPVSCLMCMQVYISEESQLHEQLCPCASVECEYCSTGLIRDHLASHCDTDCLQAPVSCNFSSFGCREKMPRNDLAQHMQEFTQLHMSYMADFLSGPKRSGSLPPAGATCVDGRCARAGAGTDTGAGLGVPGVSGVSSQDWQDLRETVQQLEGRLVLQDHQLRELSVRCDAQAKQLEAVRGQVGVAEDAVHELKAQQSEGIYVWRVEGFSAHLSSQEAGQPVVLHSPGFYTGRPGYKLCLRLQLQTPTTPRCSNYLSLFVHTMQGVFDEQLIWPLQGTISLSVLDPSQGQHVVEVMETKPDLLAFQRPTVQRNPKGFGYVTFMHLPALQQKKYVKDDTLLLRCEVTPKP